MWMTSSSRPSTRISWSRPTSTKPGPARRSSLTEPGRYHSLLEHIEVHRYYLGLQWGHEPALAEAAASWFDTVYLPIREAIRDTEIMKEFPQRTEADLYLWVAYHRERLREHYGVMPLDKDVVAALAEQFSDRPITRLVRAVARAIRAARKAAAESPEPPIEPVPVEPTPAEPPAETVSAEPPAGAGQVTAGD